MLIKRYIIGGMVAALLLGASANADVLYDFESGPQGWGSFGPLTTDSGVFANGSSGQGRFHSADFDLAGWGIVDVSPATDLSAYTGLTIDARLGNVPGFTPFDGTALMDFGIEVGGVEYYAPAVVLSDTYETFEIEFADIAPGVPLDNTIIKLRVLEGGNSGVAEFSYDQVIGVPEPASAVLLGLLALLRRR